MKALAAARRDEDRRHLERKGEEFKANAFLVNPQLAQKIWPPDAPEELPSLPEGSTARLTAEEIEGALRANGFVIESDM